MSLLIEETLNANNNFCEEINNIINRHNNFKNRKTYNGNYSDFDSNQLYLFFRGQNDYNWPLSPSINRPLKKDNRSEEEILNEYKNIEKNANLGINELIASAQHNGLKTRSIDFTSNLKVALFFAVYNIEKNETNNMDSALFVCLYSPHKINWISSTAINLISLMNEKELTNKELASLLLKNEEFVKLNRNRHNYEIDETCSDIASWLNSGFMVVYDYANEEKNMRLKKQEGALFYCGSSFYDGDILCNEIHDYSPNLNFYKIKLHKINNPDWIEDLCIKIKIPKRLNEKIYKEIGITKETLGL